MGKTKEEYLKTIKEKSYFGPIIWGFIHLASTNLYNKEDIDYLNNLIIKVLPCDECRQHFIKNKDSVTLDELDELGVFKYYRELHNIVNSQLGKKYYPYFL